MSRENETGSPIHMEVRAATDPSAVAFTIYPSGSANSVALLATQAIWITDVVLGIQGTPSTPTPFSIVSDGGGDGRVCMAGYLVEAGGITHHFETPFQCPKGETPKLTVSSDGNITTCVMQGRLVDVG